MAKPTSKRRLVENQVIFRGHNESVQAGFDKINKVAAEEGAKEYKLDGAVPLYFYCECSDENCLKRIKITPDAYDHIHMVRNSFTIMCGHEVPDVEKVTVIEKEYCVVTKYEPAPESAEKLHKTDINNV